MESRHHNSAVDHVRLLTAGYMDPQATSQMRPPYGEMCRPPGTDATSLSTYHNRYLSSMPLSTGSGFPLLGGMFSGPPSSPFRTSSAATVNNMRQFWPPTPPPDSGYGRLALNTNFFPLFGGPAESGAFLTQGLVSRLGSTTHLSPLIDHKDHSFFSHGIGLGTPLTPNSHVTSPSPYPHLIPSLERHPAYSGHMTLGGKELEEDDGRLVKSHLDCLTKHDIPSSHLKSKQELKQCCDKADNCCKLSSQESGKSLDDVRSTSNKNNNRHPTNKVQPCKIEVSHSPTLKTDLLSPPIESPKSDVTSPSRNFKKASQSSLPVSIAAYESGSQTRCSQCCASIKDIGVATKLCASDAAREPVAASDSTASSATVDTQSRDIESNSNFEKESSDSPVIPEKNESDPSFSKPNYSTTESSVSRPNNSNVTMKHVTAAVIPTAPKRDIHPELTTSQELQKSDPSTLVKEQKNFCTDSCVKTEIVELSAEKKNVIPVSCNNILLGKNTLTNSKVKDMIKNVCAVKQVCTEKPLLKNDETEANKLSSPKAVLTLELSASVSPMVVLKSNSNTQYVPTNNSPFDEVSPVMKSETANSRQDCEFTQKSNWTRATVPPFSWQSTGITQDDQAMNLTVSKKLVKPEPNEMLPEALQSNSKITSENAVLSNSGIVGVCHPNPSTIAVSKVKVSPAVSSISNFASISVLNQPTEQSTEVHILHRSSKSSFPVLNQNRASPVPLKSTISHVTANTSIHRALKTERMMSKRGKINEMDKMNHGGRTTLATLAPKLSKNVNFGKDIQTSHTISASSSVSSTSIVFPATVNPCIPVGIAIAQQRQDSSTATSIGKPPQQPPVPSSNSHLSNNRVTAELHTQEVIQDQKSQEFPISNNTTPVDANLLVTQGPTIVSRQWESEALTRTAAIPSSWVAHGSIVAPTVWLGQGAYTAPATNSVPSVAINSLDSSQISLPPGGYQLARDSITGHLLLIPTANIELMDRSSVWPAFNSSAGTLPIQQLVTQQQHTQFEQVLPQPETLKTPDTVSTSCNIAACDISANGTMKAEEKIEDMSGQVPSVPLATGQTYAFTTFPTQCDPAGFSYVLQSSTVMHLAHTQTTASIQTESGRRSQATSPLHCATPSPPPNTCSVQVSGTDDEESENESDTEGCEGNQMLVLSHSQSVTTAIQVDMDSQTNSEEDEDEEGKMAISKPDVLKVEMSDSANQTDSVPSESPKLEPETDEAEISSGKLILKEDPNPESPTEAKPPDNAPSESGLEIVVTETELAPSLPVESKPVMDFIDHHGLNLLVDSIEEFASREQGVLPSEYHDKHVQEMPKIETKSALDDKPPKISQSLEVVPPKSFSSSYKTLDTTLTDGLGLLCALAEQRFFEEALNEDSKPKEPRPFERMCAKEGALQSQSSESSAQSSVSSSPSHREQTEMEMRLQIEELQKKYKQKQRELELLRRSKEKENEDSRSRKVPLLKHLVPPALPSSLETPEPKLEKLPESSSDSNFDSKDDDISKGMRDDSDSDRADDFREGISDKIKSEDCTENSLSGKKIFQDEEFHKGDKSKTPFFDEQAWFVRRSERIFLSDAKPVADKSSKKAAIKDMNKDKKEHTVRLKNIKALEETPVRKKKNKVLKPKCLLTKKRLLSDDSSSSSSDEAEMSDAPSCTSESENIPLSTLVGQTCTNKAPLLDRQKRVSTDSEYSDDIPLSILLQHKIPELNSCTLKPDDLQENARLLVLDEGLFYAGHITKSEDPDMYGILIDGDRAARPHMFSKEEILNAAVLEVKPVHKVQLPEGSRICAFWSQQYRCLYPGTVTKASSPLPDPSMLYVEFDDGDQGRIPLSDIRMLPSDFPIVSMEPNPFNILGKRRSRAQTQNTPDIKVESASSSSKSDREKTEQKMQKNSEKVSKMSSADQKIKDKRKTKSPSATSRSHSSSKSSLNGHNDAKFQISATTKEKNKLDSKLKHTKENGEDKTLKPKKHKKHKDDHHRHHHHHHKHHHHKKHKTEKGERPHTSTETVIPSTKIPGADESCPGMKSPEHGTFILENSKSDLTVKIKKSPSPHTNNHDELSSCKVSKAKRKSTEKSSSSDEDEVSEPLAKKQKKSKQQTSPNKPLKRKERVLSMEKSKIAAFLPVRQLWRWSGKSFRRPGAKGKGKKEFYRSIQRGKETIRVGDCAVFLSTGRPHLPYIGRIETMWESWGGKMDVKVKWFYHPEETKSGKSMSRIKGALFQSPHFDENDVQTVSHKCEVLSWSEYQEKSASENIEDNNDTYFLAGTYDPIMGTLILEAGVPNVSSEL